MSSTQASVLSWARDQIRVHLTEKWQHLPQWRVWNSPAEQWQVLPSFLIIEYGVYLMVLLSLLHASRSTGDARRPHLVLWLACFLTGTANDVFFMALPLVDNFWQAQATVMLTPRLPLYIPCVYNVFLYYATAVGWQLTGSSSGGVESRLSVARRALFSSLLAVCVYGPYDICGAKFIWWSWHSTDPPIATRLLGAPLGSTLWILTFTGTFAFTLNWLLQRCRLPTAATLAVSALVTTPAMMAQMALFQWLAGERQGQVGWPTFTVGFSIYLASASAVLLLLPALAGHRSSRKTVYISQAHRVVQRPAPDRLATRRNLHLLLSLCLYFLLLTGVMLWSDPAAHRSRGVHQAVGPCDQRAMDFTGQLRDMYVCPDRLHYVTRQEWDFQCLTEAERAQLKAAAASAPSGSAAVHWYTICGRHHEDKQSYLAGVVGLALVGGLLSSLVLL